MEHHYQFVTIADITASNIGNTVAFDSTSLYEGTYVTIKYIVDTSDVEQRFILTDNRADTTTLRVRVQTQLTDSTCNNLYKSNRYNTTLCNKFCILFTRGRERKI